jgi:hypothetical protein
MVTSSKHKHSCFFCRSPTFVSWGWKFLPRECLFLSFAIRTELFGFVQVLIESSNSIPFVLHNFSNMSVLCDFINEILLPLRFSKYYIVRERLLLLLTTLFAWLPTECTLSPYQTRHHTKKFFWSFWMFRLEWEKWNDVKKSLIRCMRAADSKFWTDLYSLFFYIIQTTSRFFDKT